MTLAAQVDMIGELSRICRFLAFLGAKTALKTAIFAVSAKPHLSKTVIMLNLAGIFC
jgi:hypothetical protein